MLVCAVIWDTALHHISVLNEPIISNDLVLFCFIHNSVSKAFSCTINFLYVIRSRYSPFMKSLFSNTVHNFTRSPKLSHSFQSSPLRLTSLLSLLYTTSRSLIISRVFLLTSSSQQTSTSLLYSFKQISRFMIYSQQIRMIILFTSTWIVHLYFGSIHHNYRRIHIKLHQDLRVYARRSILLLFIINELSIFPHFENHRQVTETTTDYSIWYISSFIHLSNMIEVNLWARFRCIL